MSFIGWTVLVLLHLQLIPAHTPEALDYVLRSIEYLASVHGGVFSCIFYDVAPHGSYDNILDAILKSPRIDHVAKYVLNGTYHDDLEKLPWNPSLLLVHPGYDVEFLKRNETIWNMIYLMTLFNPTTKVLVFVDLNKQVLVEEIESKVGASIFCYSVYFDSLKMKARHCNGVWCATFPGAFAPMYLFTLGHRYKKGRNITFVSSLTKLGHEWNSNWINESARYLFTEIVELPHNCDENTGRDTLNQCLKQYEADKNKADIGFSIMLINGNLPRDFRQLFTTIPYLNKILVPRDRPLNAAELIVMPFSWEVWILVIVMLISTEIINHLFPDMFKNDPILLVVCGFERFDLHRANRWEKLILHSLMVLMFFLSNAFETKIISLMVSRPSIQRIKTLADFLQSDLKFYEDLENHPYLVNQSFGKMMVQGKKRDYLQIIPGEAQYVDSFWVDLLVETMYDYERKQPYYVVLDYDHLVGPWQSGGFSFWKCFATSTTFWLKLA